MRYFSKKTIKINWFFCSVYVYSLGFLSLLTLFGLFTFPSILFQSIFFFTEPFWILISVYLKIHEKTEEEEN